MYHIDHQTVPPRMTIQDYDKFLVFNIFVMSLLAYLQVMKKEGGSLFSFRHNQELHQQIKFHGLTYETISTFGTICFLNSFREIPSCFEIFVGENDGLRELMRNGECKSFHFNYITNYYHKCVVNFFPWNLAINIK